MDIPDYLKSQIDDLDKKIAEATNLAQDPGMAEMAAEEIKKLVEEKNLLINSASPQPETQTASSSPEAKYDNRNAIVEIRGAAGGEEAKLWGEDLLRMYSRYAQNQGWRVAPEGPLSIKILGRGVFSKLKYESGVHRVQRVPVTESSGRVHTSTATVAVLPELEDIDIHIEPADLDWDFFRGGGHGGQNVNKVSSAVRLTYKPTGQTITCSEERDQSKNRDKALKKLRQNLWEEAENKRLTEMSAERLSQIGTGMRNEKIRTYNFLQDRVTDHRLDKNFHNIQVIMDGKIDEIILDLFNKFQEATPNK